MAIIIFLYRQQRVGFAHLESFTGIQWSHHHHYQGWTPWIIKAPCWIRDHCPWKWSKNGAISKIRATAVVTTDPIRETPRKTETVIGLKRCFVSMQNWVNMKDRHWISLKHAWRVLQVMNHHHRLFSPILAQSLQSLGPSLLVRLKRYLTCQCNCFYLSAKFQNQQTTQTEQKTPLCSSKILLSLEKVTNWVSSQSYILQTRQIFSFFSHAIQGCWAHSAQCSSAFTGLLEAPTPRARRIVLYDISSHYFHVSKWAMWLYAPIPDLT